jgi:sulfur-carrier protein adenylyltransferase/sulfurtransferase
MQIAQYFKKVETVPAAALREFLAAHTPDEYNLVDVRSPQEYGRGHLPGARLIPLGELPQRLSELDRTKRTCTY